MSTLLKWLFTFFAFWWLYHALRPWLSAARPTAPPPPSDPSPPERKEPKKGSEKLGEYIDYEEINDD